MKSSLHRWYSGLQGLFSVKIRKMALGRNDLSSLPLSGAHKKDPNTGYPHTGAVHFLTPSQAERKNWSFVLLLLSDFQVSQVDEAPGKAQLVVQSVKINGEILKVEDSVRDQHVKLQDSLTNIDHAASPKKVRVYISYARSSAEHTNNVAALASWLRDQGNRCHLWHFLPVGNFTECAGIYRVRHSRHELHHRRLLPVVPCLLAGVEQLPELQQRRAERFHKLQSGADKLRDSSHHGILSSSPATRKALCRWSWHNRH